MVHRGSRQEAHKAEGKSQLIRVGLVGAGYIAGFAHLPAFSRMSSARVVALCDEDLQRARNLGGRFGIPSVYNSVESMLANEVLDLVDVCVPPHRHRDALVKALRYGVPCLVEKPLTVSLADADEVIALAEVKDLPVFVIFNYSFLPGIVRAKRLIAGGAIGEVINVHISHGIPWNPRHLASDHWCHTLPGGYFSEIGPHLVMLLVEFMGHVGEVHSHVFKRSELPIARFDELRVFARNGSMTGSITCSLNCPSRLLTVDILGTKGALHIDGNSQAVVHYGPIASSMDAWARGVAAALDISSRIVALASTAAGVLLGRYPLEVYGHLYLIRRSIQALKGLAVYPVNLEDVRESVRLLESVFSCVPTSVPEGACDGEG